MSEDPTFQPAGLSGLSALAGVSGLDLSTVSTDYPILQPGIVPFLIQKAYYDKSKPKQVTDPTTGETHNHVSELIMLELVTTQPVNDKSGQPVGPGYKLTHRLALTPTDKMDVRMILGNVAQLLEAVFGEEERKKIDLGSFDVAMLTNQPVLVRVATAPEKDGYPEKTQVSRFVKKEASKTGSTSTMQAPAHSTI